MKRSALKSALVAVLAIFVFGGVAVAASQPYRSGTNVVVAANEVVGHSLFVSGSTVTVAGTVNGDVFCAGQTVFITGTVNGDVMCIGQEVNISGTVNGSVRAAGQSVSIAGTVQRAVSLAGQSVSVQPNAKIGGDATLAGSSVNIAGTLARDVYVAGETVTVTGSIARNLDVRTDNLNVSAESIGGDVSQVKSPAPVEQKSSTLPLTGIKLAVFFGLAMFVTAMALVAVAPRKFQSLADDALPKPGKTLLVGLLVAFLLPIALVTLLVTIVGIPLAIMLGIIWAGAALLSGPVFAYIVGRRLMRQSHKPLAIMAVGSLVVLLLYMIPVVNFFVGSIAYLMGLGAITNMLKRSLGKPKYTI